MSQKDFTIPIWCSYQGTPVKRKIGVVTPSWEHDETAMVFIMTTTTTCLSGLGNNPQLLEHNIGNKQEGGNAYNGRLAIAVAFYFEKWEEGRYLCPSAKGAKLRKMLQISKISPTMNIFKSIWFHKRPLIELLSTRVQTCTNHNLRTVHLFFRTIKLIQFLAFVKLLPFIQIFDITDELLFSIFT